MIDYKKVVEAIDSINLFVKAVSEVDCSNLNRDPSFAIRFGVKLGFLINRLSIVNDYIEQASLNDLDQIDEIEVMIRSLKEYFVNINCKVINNIINEGGAIHSILDDLIQFCRMKHIMLDNNLRTKEDLIQYVKTNFMLKPISY